MSGVLADVLQPCPPCVAATLTVRDLIDVFDASQADRVLVVGDNDQLIGAIGLRDLTRTVCLSQTIGRLAGRHVLTAKLGTSIRRAANVFLDGVDQCVIILDDGRPVGCVRPEDVLHSSSAPHSACAKSSWAGAGATGQTMSRPHFLSPEVTSEHDVRSVG